MLGLVALLTAAALWRRRQPARIPLVYAALALGAGAALFAYGR